MSDFLDSLSEELLTDPIVLVSISLSVLSGRTVQYKRDADGRSIVCSELTRVTVYRHILENKKNTVYKKLDAK